MAHMAASYHPSAFPMIDDEDVDSVRRRWQQQPHLFVSDKKKRRSIMQRLSCWFEDHLPLRRLGSRRASASSKHHQLQQRRSTSSKPTSRFPLAAIPRPDCMSVSYIEPPRLRYDNSFDENLAFDGMSASAFGRLPSSAGPPPAPANGTTARLPRTNPWVAVGPSRQYHSLYRNTQQQRVPASQLQEPVQACIKPRPPPELLFSSMDRSAQLRVKSLDESTCSSGYGSQDSSPESSTHSPDWQQPRSVEEQASIECRVDAAPAVDDGYDLYMDDDHVYHELESLQRLSLLLEDFACSSELGSPEPTEDVPASSRTSSPIYAVPYDSRASLASGFEYMEPQPTKQPLSIESPFFRQPPTSAVPRRLPRTPVEPPTWHCPPPPPAEEAAAAARDRDRRRRSPPPADDGDILAELDKQIHELQQQSDAVRLLVEQAKERQELRERTRLLCMEHINELRKMRWFMRNNFELCL